MKGLLYSVAVNMLVSVINVNSMSVLNKNFMENNHAEIVVNIEDRKLAKIADTCSPNPCQNGGTCTVEGGLAKCRCPKSYFGYFCENDPCSFNPCKNGGTCVVEEGAPICKCPNIYSGDFCERDPCYLRANLCENGGICIVKNGLGKCKCLDGYFGSFCENDYCSYVPCKNGGTCAIEEGVMKCKCPDNYSGYFCDEEISTSMTSNDESISSTKHSWDVTFDEDFSKDEIYSTNHENDENVTNAGVKITSVAPMTPMTTSIYSSTPLDPCSVSPCRNGGSCFINGDSFICVCPNPYTGFICERDSCSFNPCQNNGICKLENGAPKCYCEGSFSGENCETDNDSILFYYIVAISVLSTSTLFLLIYVFCQCLRRSSTKFV